MLCLYESGTRLAGEVEDDLIAFLDRSPSDTPWAGAQVFETHVRRNIKLAESPSYGQSIFDYEPASNGAKDYAAIVREVIAMEATMAAETGPATIALPTAAKATPTAGTLGRAA